MAYPLSARYGRTTYAFLAACWYCGRPYDESGEWHAVKGDDSEADVWFLVCDGCLVEVKEEDNDR